jgi:hypothetical protein
MEMRCDCARCVLAWKDEGFLGESHGWIIGCLFPDLTYICQSLGRLTSIDYLLHHIL